MHSRGQTLLACAAVLMLAACGGKSATGSSGPAASTSRQPATSASTSPASTSATTPSTTTAAAVPLTVENLGDRLSDFASSAKGIRGTASLAEVAGSVTGSFTGPFTCDLDFSQPRNSELKLAVVPATSVSALDVRAVDGELYLQATNAQTGAPIKWRHLDQYGTAATDQDQLLISALFLAGVSPYHYVDLVRGSKNLKALGRTTVNGVVTQGFSGSTDIFQHDPALTELAGLADIQLSKEGVKGVAFEVYLDSQGRLVRAKQRLVATAYRDDYTIDIKGYSAPAVAAPVGG